MLSFLRFCRNNESLSTNIVLFSIFINIRYLSSISPVTQFDCDQIGSLSMTSESKITVSGKQLQLTLNCKSISKNIAKILKELQDTSRLYLIPSPEGDRASELITKSRQYEGTPFRRSCMQVKPIPKHQYIVNSNQALQMIWRSALIAKQNNLCEMDLQEIKYDRIIGEVNKLDQQVVTLKSTISKIADKYGRRHPKISEGQQLLAKLIEKKEQIQEVWKNIRKKQNTLTKQIFTEPLINLVSIKLEEEEKVLILKFIRGKILEFDRQLLIETIAFILEIDELHCAFSLEDPYPCFKGKKQILLEILGLKVYQQGLKDVALTRQEAKRQGVPFKPSLFKVCHKCLDIVYPEGKQDFICPSKQVVSDPTATPYAYQQLILLSNYTATAELYAKKKKGQQQKKNESEFSKYCHPYLKTYTKTCGRYICKHCFDTYLPNKKKTHHENQADIDQNEGQPKDSSSLTYQGELPNQNTSKDKHISVKSSKLCEKIHKPQRCNFCECICDCDRCRLAELFNKFTSFYQSFGGNFMKQIAPHLLFCNLSKGGHFQQISQAQFDNLCYKKDVIQLRRARIKINEQEIAQLSISRASKNQKEDKCRDKHQRRRIHSSTRQKLWVSTQSLEGYTHSSKEEEDEETLKDKDEDEEEEEGEEGQADGEEQQEYEQNEEELTARQKLKALKTPTITQDQKSEPTRNFSIKSNPIFSLKDYNRKLRQQPPQKVSTKQALRMHSEQLKKSEEEDSQEMLKQTNYTEIMNYYISKNEDSEQSQQK